VPPVPTPNNNTGFGLFRWNRFVSGYRTLSSKANSKNKGYSLSPNPTQGKVFIQTPNNKAVKNIELFDKSGKKIEASYNASNYAIELSFGNRLKAGSYTVVITIAEGKVGLPLILQ
jgi:hypothetical protein